MSDLAQKVALITGASSGIGAATAKYFASLGCYLAINGRNVERLNETRKECIQAGLPREKVLTVLGDVGSHKGPETIIEKTIEHFGRLDILVNNAGFSTAKPLQAITITDFDDVIAVNLRGSLLMAKYAVPHLKKTKGNIINVSSVLGQVPNITMTPYCGSKAALDQTTKCLAVELGPFGIRVNCISPGYVLTDIFNKAGLPPQQVKEYIAKLGPEHVLGRLAEPLEIAKPIAFLASDAASFMTGTVMLVDGGFALKK